MIAESNLPATIASRYVPVRLIARGGMGAVYEVEHSRTGEHLALKVLHSSVGSTAEELERFKREARASARIKSQHVVRVIDADVAPELGGAPFLVMELLEGADLERVAKSALPDPATVVDWLRQVARALDKAHSLGIVHRDLKPENLFLATAEDRPPIVKVLDFGILKMTEEGTGATGSGQILGTPRYMAPEQASTNGRITSAVDRYSLGLVAYRLLAGESYYRGDVMSVLAQLLHEPLEPPSRRNGSLGAEFDVWFLKACSRIPEERFGSAVEQIEALSAVLNLPSVAFGPMSEPATRGEPRVRARKWTIAAGVGIAGLVAISVAGMALSRRTIDPESIPQASRSTSTPSLAPTPRPPPPHAISEPPVSKIEPFASGPDGATLKPATARRVRGSAKGGPQGRRATDGQVVGRPITEPSVTPLDAETPPPPDPYAEQK